MTREARKPRTSPYKRRKRKPCFFCIEQRGIDYKDTVFVRRFMTDRGKIAPRRISGCCVLHQRMVATAIKRARQIGTVPYVVD